MHWHVDLVVLATCLDELIHLLYDHPRDPEEVDMMHLFALGLAIGTLANEAARWMAEKSVDNPPTNS